MFYDKFKKLCDVRGVSCNKAATEIGLSNATPTAWKKRGLTPKGDTLLKIADYFDVPVDFLLEAEDNIDSVVDVISQHNAIHDWTLSQPDVPGRVKAVICAERPENAAGALAALQCKADQAEAAESGKTSPSVAARGEVAEKETPPVEEDEELNEYLEMLKTRKECRMLFQLAKNATKEDVEQAVKIIEALRK